MLGINDGSRQWQELPGNLWGPNPQRVILKAHLEMAGG